MRNGVGRDAPPMNEALLRSFLQSFTMRDSIRNLFGGNHPLAHYYHLAGCIIGWKLGSNWLVRHVMSQESRTDFFRANYVPDVRFNRFIARVGHLADLLYNLQDVGGVADRIDSIRTADGDGVEA